MKPQDDPVLKRFRAELAKLYGDRIERIVLFGSRARGDARPESDYDVAVFLKDLTDRWLELDRIIPVVVDIMGETHAVISAKPFPVSAWQDRTLLMHEVRREGIEV